ncbi:hypothetical protein [Streptomyces sp. Ac-502]|uniref:hypothetical protein n=1 Tax=Streptomyces sp. Ac-502 TaxID=3342801 RepID=UPI0038623DA8
MEDGVVLGFAEFEPEAVGVGSAAGRSAMDSPLPMSRAALSPPWVPSALVDAAMAGADAEGVAVGVGAWSVADAAGAASRVRGLMTAVTTAVARARWSFIETFLGEPD